MDAFDYIVNKFNIRVGNQYFIDIPQMVGGADLAKLFAELDFNLGAEIGTDQGLFAEVLCQANPNLSLTCVDPWKAEAYDPNEQPESKESQSFFDKRYEETVERLKPYGCHIVRATSQAAALDIPDNSLDFIYIDANHDFLNVAMDLHYWLKKVRVGGILSGHDYASFHWTRHNHVKQVVQAYMISYNLLPVFAVMNTKKGLKRDRVRSWFYIKQ